MSIDDEEELETDMYDLPIVEPSITLPKYSASLQENERLVGIEGEREGIDVVLNFSKAGEGGVNPYPSFDTPNARILQLRQLAKLKKHGPRISYHGIGIGRCNGNRVLPPYPEPALLPEAPNTREASNNTYLYGFSNNFINISRTLNLRYPSASASISDSLPPPYQVLSVPSVTSTHAFSNNANQT